MATERKRLECTALAIISTTWKHDKVAQVNHWDISKKCGFEATENWCNHKYKPDPVGDSVKCKFLWAFKIHADPPIAHHKFDIVLLGVKEISCLRESARHYSN